MTPSACSGPDAAVAVDAETLRTGPGRLGDYPPSDIRAFVSARSGECGAAPFSLCVAAGVGDVEKFLVGREGDRSADISVTTA